MSIEALALTRWGIVLTLFGALLISPEVLTRARGLIWVDRIFVIAKDVVLRLEHQARFPVWLLSNESTRNSMKTAIGKGAWTKHVFLMTALYLSATASACFLILLLFGFISIGALLSAWPSIKSILVLLLVFCTLFWLIGTIRISLLSYSIAIPCHLSNIRENKFMSKQMGENILWSIYLVFIPLIVYLGSAINGLLWVVSDIAIVFRSPQRRAWIAVIGFAFFIIGQGLQLIATFQ